MDNQEWFNKHVCTIVMGMYVFKCPRCNGSYPINYYKVTRSGKYHNRCINCNEYEKKFNHTYRNKIKKDKFILVD